jgi:hypothetical protein
MLRQLRVMLCRMIRTHRYGMHFARRPFHGYKKDVLHPNVAAISADPLVQLLLDGGVPFHDTNADQKYNLLEYAIISDMPLQYIEWLASHDYGTFFSEAFRHDHSALLSPWLMMERSIAAEAGAHDLRIWYTHS